MKLNNMNSHLFFNLKLKERWEDFKKSIIINPQGNRVRFVPIIPNNVNHHKLPSNSSRKLLIKPFIPKYMVDCPNKDIINIVQQHNDRENKNLMPATYTETPINPAIFNKNLHQKSVSLQTSQKRQEIQQLNTSTSFIDKFDMKSLENSLRKLPLSTIWTNNDNRSKEFGCTLPLKNNTFEKPYLPDLHFSSQAMQGTNYEQKSTLQNKTQVLPNPLNTINNSSYFISSNPLTTTPNQNVYPIAENMNTSFFTSNIAGQSMSTASQNMNYLESNSSSYINETY